MQDVGWKIETLIQLHCNRESNAFLTWVDIIEMRIITSNSSIDSVWVGAHWRDVDVAQAITPPFAHLIKAENIPLNLLSDSPFQVHHQYQKHTHIDSA